MLLSTSSNFFGRLRTQPEVDVRQRDQHAAARDAQGLLPRPGIHAEQHGAVVRLHDQQHIPEMGGVDPNTLYCQWPCAARRLILSSSSRGVEEPVNYRAPNGMNPLGAKTQKRTRSKYLGERYVCGDLLGYMFEEAKATAMAQQEKADHAAQRQRVKEARENEKGKRALEMQACAEEKYARDEEPTRLRAVKKAVKAEQKAILRARRSSPKRTKLSVAKNPPIEGICMSAGPALGGSIPVPPGLRVSVAKRLSTKQVRRSDRATTDLAQLDTAQLSSAQLSFCTAQLGQPSATSAKLSSSQLRTASLSPVRGGRGAGGAQAAGRRDPHERRGAQRGAGSAGVRAPDWVRALAAALSVGAADCFSLSLCCSSKVRLTNEHFYFLTFPAPPTADGEEALVDYSLLAEQSQRTVIRKRQSRQAAESVATVDLTTEDSDEDESVEEEESPDGYFSICGMVDGVADALTISADDEWGLTPVVVEVKNRVRGFRDPPPLYDHIQLAVYMKMLGVEHGDLVQCMYGADSCPNIQVSRVSLGVAPLCLPASSTEQRQRDIWTEVIVPRLYAFTAAVQKLRNEELLRLAFLNGTEEERLAIVRAECDFL
ncbi:hypothetical protein ON010_g4659 [Phytophthora cinnamomi]|nr:hypothetical protein ON010_g4659 [Phytophthora cinnamomi]